MIDTLVRSTAIETTAILMNSADPRTVKTLTEREILDLRVEMLKESVRARNESQDRKKTRKFFTRK